MSIFASLSASKQSSLPGPSTTTFRATRRVEAEAEEEEDQIPIPEAQQRPSRLRLDRAAANRFIVNAVRAAEGKEQIQSQERAKQKSLLPNNAKHQWPSANAQTNKKSLPKRTTTATTATTATAKRKPLKSTAEVTAADSNDAPKKRATTAKTTVKKKSVAAKKKKLLLMKKQNPLNRNGERESDHDDAAADDGNVKGAKRKKTRGWLVRQFPEVLLAVPSLPPLCSSEEKRGRRVQYYMCIGKCKRLLLYQQLRASALKELESLFQHSSQSPPSTEATRGSSTSSSSNIFAATLNNNNNNNNSDNNIFSQHYEAEEQQNASSRSTHKTRSVVTISPTAQQGSNAPWIHATLAVPPSLSLRSPSSSPSPISLFQQRSFLGLSPSPPSPFRSS
ncbi:Gustatory receptor [Balamuthia mandrillaris]